MIKSPRAIRECQRLDQDEFTDKVMTGGQPVVLRQQIASWPLIEHGAKGPDALANYLLQFHRGAMVNRMVGAAEIEGRLFYDDTLTDLNFETDTHSFMESVKAIADVHQRGNGETVYIGASNLEKLFPGLKDVLDMPLAPKHVVPNLWMGTPTKVGPHNDLPDNIACVVTGRRKFRLFPPEQVRNLYVGPHEVTPAGRPVSYVPIDEVDFERFPAFAEALDASFEALLEPGDAIFIPALWWHSVQSLDPFNLMLNYWWDPTPKSSSRANGAFIHGLLSLSQLPRAQREAWRDYFEHYVFRLDGDPAEHIPEEVQGRLGPHDAEIADALRNAVRMSLIEL